MKNQSFHQRKIRLPETPELDYDQLKSRTVIALGKLGHQKFSTEPGGYSLENWIRGVNILLDEFEGKMGEGKLSPDYIAKRHELNDRVSEPVSTTSIDESISSLNQNLADVQGRINAGREHLVSKVVELKNERDRCSTELVQEQERISSLETVQKPDSFLKRLLGGGSKTSTKDLETDVKELESRIGLLSDEILEQQRLLRLFDQHSPESQSAEDWKVLESLQTRLGALASERVEKVQLVKEREEITASIADTISKMPP
jgi:hypothetical protein